MRFSPLNAVRIGETARIGNNLCTVKLTITGCRDCVFEKESGAKFCDFTAFCFAHNRPDRQSVKFVKIEK